MALEPFTSAAPMTLFRSLAAGLAGSLALTALHQAAVALTDRAPRMDVLGMRALAGLARGAGTEPPENLYATTLWGDVAGNALYYGLVGTARSGDEVRRGLFLGVVAGAGAVALPPVLGLGQAPSGRTVQTAAMAVAWYVAGGLAAGAAARALR